MNKNTKRMFKVLIAVIFIGGCYGAAAPGIMLMNVGMTAVGLGAGPALDKMAENTSPLPWKEVRLQMDISGEPKDVRSLRELAERTLRARGVRVNSTASYTMRVAEVPGKWLGVEVLNRKRISVAEVTVLCKTGYSRAYLLKYAIRNIKKMDGTSISSTSDKNKKGG